MKRTLIGPVSLARAIACVAAAIAATLLWVEGVGIAPAVGDLQFDARLFWSLHPGLLSGVNADGYRGARVPQAKPPETTRIVALGDSSTYAVGCLSAESAYPQQLAERVRAAGRACDVLNLGVPGYTIEQGLRRLAPFARRYDPDVALFMFGHNDRQSSRTGLADRDRVLAGVPLDSPRFLRRFRLARAYRFGHARWVPRPGAHRGSMARVPLDRYRLLVAQSIETCRRFGIEPVWIEYAQIPPGIPPDDYNDAARDECERAGATWIATGRLADEGERAFMADGIHPNTVGQGVLADVLFERLRDRLVSPGSPQSADDRP